MLRLSRRRAQKKPLPMAGRLDMKGRSDPEEDLGISRGDMENKSNFLLILCTSGDKIELSLFSVTACEHLREKHVCTFSTHSSVTISRSLQLD